MKNFDEIEKENYDSSKEEKIKEVRQDINNLMNGMIEDFDDIIKRRQIQNELKRKKQEKGIKYIIKKITYFVFYSLGIVMFVNLVLANIWLLVYFIKFFFGLSA
jgi:hypothetical protein